MRTVYRQDVRVTGCGSKKPLDLIEQALSQGGWKLTDTTIDAAVHNTEMRDYRSRNTPLLLFLRLWEPDQRKQAFTFYFIQTWWRCVLRGGWATKFGFLPGEIMERMAESVSSANGRWEVDDY